MRGYPFRKFFEEELMQDPDFRREWENGQPEFEAMCADIERRIAADEQAKKQKIVAPDMAVA